MRIVNEEILISRGHIVSAEQQKRLDLKHMDRIPQEGMLIVYNEKNNGRTVGGYFQARRGCFRIVDTHSHPLFVRAMECRRPGYEREVALYKNDFLHSKAEWIEVEEAYYPCGDSALSWSDFDLANFEEGRYIG